MNLKQFKVQKIKNMKHLLFYIVCLLVFFKSVTTLASEITLPQDFEGEHTKARLQLFNNEDNINYLDTSIPEAGLIFYEIGKYFHEKYPGIEFFEKDLTEDLRSFLPNATQEELNSWASKLRAGVQIYRIGNNLYQKYVSEKLAPKVYRVVKSDKDYNHPDEVEYIQAQDGHFVKVYNFKKFLTYSNNLEERRAIEKYKKQMDPNGNFLDKIDNTLKKIEWNKLIYYGSDYHENPLYSKSGVGEFQTGIYSDARLLSSTSTIDNQSELKIGVHIINKNNTFTLANNLDYNLTKPQITLSDSQNIASYEVYYPIPINTASQTFAHKYFDNYVLPVKIKIKDPTQPVIVNAKVELTSCDSLFNCIPETFNLMMEIATETPDLFNNGYNNFINNAFSALPKNQAQHHELKKFVIDHNDYGQSLRLEFESTKTIKSFKIFIEDKDAFVRFSTPLISIQDNKIYAFIRPMNEYKNIKLDNSEFSITTNLNAEDAYRTTRIAKAASPMDSNAPKLNMGLILVAVLGGLILNLMPCVFPVLSLKIIGLSNLGNKKRQNMKKTLLVTVAGIFCGFTILLIILLFTKYLGYSLGWGMQFQNMKFLVAMTFVLATITCIFPQLNTTKLQNIGSRTGTRFNFLLGNLIVLLSTPCTGPYLATAVGFALSSNYVDIVIIIYGIALGLSLPYILAYLLKNPQNLLPPRGEWIEKLQKITRIMLLLTIVWFFALIWGQTDWLCITILLAILMFFIFMFNMYKRFIDTTDEVFEESITLHTLQKMRKNSTIIISIIFVLCLIISIFVAEKSYNKNLNHNMENRLTFIDHKLINDKLMQGRSVLLEIGADWCMTCHFNSINVLNSLNIKSWKKNYDLDYIRVDWTNYNREILDFMSQYGRKGLPFYILYTPLLREGIVLPEIFSSEDILNMITYTKIR